MITYQKQIGITNEWVSISKKKDGVQVLSIPLDPANTDYQQYLEWTKASPMNVAEPADE